MSVSVRAGLVVVLVSIMSAVGALEANAGRLGCSSDSFGVGPDAVCVGTSGPTQTFVGHFETTGADVFVEAYGGPVVAANPAQPAGTTMFAGSVIIRVWCNTADCQGNHEFRGEGRGSYLPLDPNKLRLYGQAGDMAFDVDFHGYGNYALWPNACGEWGCPGTPNPFYPDFLTRPAVGTGGFSVPALGISFVQGNADARQLLL
jgi:hypothetical protein